MISLRKFNPIESDTLIGLGDHFSFIKDLISKDKLPKVTLLTGKKGIGKFTLVSHLMHFYFDKLNYDEKKNTFKKKNSFYIQFSENLFPNIFHLEGENFKNVKIDDIRKLKKDLQKTSLIRGKRFIILDDIEIFNINSLNGLLKIIEEPSSNDHFILINNKSQRLLETIKSRCLEIKIILDNITRKKNISTLLNIYNQDDVFNFNTTSASPGNYLKFNYLFNEMSLNTEESLINNFKNILSFYKKDKNILYKDFLLFLVDFYIQKNTFRKDQNPQLLIDKRSLIMKNINNFFVHNLSSNTFLNSIEGKIK